MTYTVKYRGSCQKKMRKAKWVVGDGIRPNCRYFKTRGDAIEFRSHDTLIFFPPQREQMLRRKGSAVPDNKKEAPCTIRYRLFGDILWSKLKEVVWYGEGQYCREFLLDDETRVCIPYSADVSFPKEKQKVTGEKMSAEAGQQIARAI